MPPEQQPPRPSDRAPNPDPDPFARIVFPTLPILRGDEVRKSDREKYGALFYLGTVGLAVIVTLVVWFAWEAWTLRDVWMNVYTLHDSRKGEVDRVQAAYSLAHDPRVNQRQRFDNALSKPLPPLARYILAESLTAEAASADPRAYGLAVARSEGWPVWLRMLLTRPMAYAAARGLLVDPKALELLADNPDRATALWANYALAAGPESDFNAIHRSAAHKIFTASQFDGPDREFALLLLAALNARKIDDRLKSLDSATLWLRTHHPEAARLWDGWKVVGNRIVPAR